MRKSARILVALLGGWLALALAAPALAQSGPARLALRLREGQDLDAAGLERLLRSHGVRPERVAPTFARSRAQLRAERARAQRRSGRRLADLSLFFNVELPAASDPAAVSAALRGLDVVESVEPWPVPMPPPVDLAPPTPSFVGLQTYRASAPAGAGFASLAGASGADGAGLRYVDIEFGWVLDHEDLELGSGAVVPTGTAQNPYADQGSHGSAILGLLSARDNAYGITGLVPAAQARVAAAYTSERSWDVGYAIEQALAVSAPGDLILIEQQVCVCGSSCPGGSQAGAGPVEWFTPWREAIATATALGVVVVAAAGNGAVNLDAAACGGAFDRSLYDSGAIFVGAGSAAHAPLSYASYGSRVDVQGIAEGLVTLGGGNLFDPGDVRQRYQSSFGGSSGASALVAGAALAVQGGRRARGLDPLEPAELRALLVETGTPQAADARHIGPLPDAQQAYSDATSIQGAALPPVGRALLAGALALVLGGALARRARASA